VVVGQELSAARIGRQLPRLQAQLEGTENRVAVARNRYIKAVEQYNVTVRQFPNNLICDGLRLQARNPISASRTSGDSKAPQVDFGQKQSKRSRHHSTVIRIVLAPCWLPLPAWAQVACRR
jgi:LemA protein